MDITNLDTQDEGAIEALALLCEREDHLVNGVLSEHQAPEFRRQYVATVSLNLN